MSTYSGGVTPYRKTHLRFDVPDVVRLESPFGLARHGAEIARGDPTVTGSVNVHLLHSGCWAMLPLQERTHYLNERTDTCGSIQQLADYDTIPGMVSAPRFRTPTDQTGVTTDAAVQASGDSFLQKTVAAGDSWAQSLTSDVSSYGQPTYDTANVPMDRHAVGKTTHPANQPFYLRFEVPLTKAHSPDMLKTFYFGGQAASDGSGQYGLGLAGDGTAILFEKIGGVWTGRAKWRYADPGQVCDRVHTLRIWPHLHPDGGGYIEFRSGLADSGAAAGFNLTSAVFQSPSGPRTFLYPCVPPTGAIVNRPNATGPGNVRIDTRQDLRPKWQVSLLSYPTSATLIDLPFALLEPPVNLVAGVLPSLAIFWHAAIIEGSGCSVTGKLFDATTDVELSLITDGGNYRLYTPNAGQVNYYAKFEFVATCESSPYLWSYGVIRDTVGGTVSVTEFEGGQLERISITGPERDPSHETASFTLDDLTADMLALNTRAGHATSIETEYEPGDPAKRSVLIRGYNERSEAERRGMNARAGMSGNGGNALYPSYDWRRYEGTVFAQWQRLMEQLTWGRLPLLRDPLTPNSAPLPYKITDVVKSLLYAAGYPPEMVDVPDSPIRFFPGPKNDPESLIIEPLIPIGDAILHFTRDYLIQFLIFDANAGTTGTNGMGMWRLRKPNVAPFTNLADFTTIAPAYGKAAWRPESYGSRNWVSTDGSLVHTFIRKRSLHTYIKKPEATGVQVSGTGQLLTNNSGRLRAVNQRNNPACFDPNSPDWTGRQIGPAVYVNRSLGADTAQNQAAIDWFTNRLYDLTCHGIKIARFQSPLVLVTDPNDALQVNPRPLRYYDPVTVTTKNGTSQWLVRNCNPAYVKDGMQMANYELQNAIYG